ncbi:MAG: protein kinase domain-containing protein [Acidithiobacillales bacterium]
MNPVDERGRLIGELLGERYEVLGLLGKGGFASVYQVRNRNLERLEALKVLDESRSAESDVTKRFVQEARLVASLEHPGIIRIHDFGNAGGFLWFTMQYVDGPSLALRLERHGRLHEEETARVGAAILDALDYAHSRGVIHRDIKPANILLDAAGRPILSDFGIAKAAESLTRTRTGFVLGSPGYLSPEQLRGESLDGRSDLYSLGITLYELLTNSVPFDSEEAVATVVRRLTEQAEPISRRLPGIDPELERIVMRALATAREARYPSAREMKADLEAYLAKARQAAGEGAKTTTTSVLLAAPAAPPRPTAPLPPLPAETAGVPRPRRPWRRRAAPFAVLVALAAAASFVFRSTSPRSTAPPEGPPRPEGRLRLSPTTPLPPPVPTPPTPTSVPATPAPRTDTIARRASSAPRKPASPSPPELRRPKYPPDFVEPPVVVAPAELAAACAGKVVGLSLVVAEDGSLGNAIVISSSGVPACDDLVLSSVRRARYRPALAADGKPVEGRFAVSVPF